jgi:outer membrane protein OmpA-like peptidoglycan-associated protein
MKLLRLLFALVALSAISACASPMQVSEVQAVTAAVAPIEGSTFAKALFEGYQQRARHEAEVEHEWRHAVIFARKAARIATGEIVAPEELSQWDLPEAAVPLLADARARLMGHLDQGARDRVPEAAAKAQAAFDCWVEEEWERDTDTECKDTFLATEGLLQAPVVVTAPVPVPPAVFVVTFDFDKDEIRAGTMQTLWEVAQTAKAAQPRILRIHGHADAVGGKRYNQKLSERRAKAVAKQLSKLGLGSDGIEIKGFGRDRPAVADKGRQERNRRVTVELVFESPNATTADAAVPCAPLGKIIPAPSADTPPGRQDAGGTPALQGEEAATARPPILSRWERGPGTLD